MKPKFELGDIVECVFTGVVEGETVTVRKRLFVRCVKMYFNQMTRVVNFAYGVCENDPSKHFDEGRHYDKAESDLIELERVVQEVERNNRVVKPAVTVPQLDPSVVEALRSMNSARQQWTSDGTSVPQVDYRGLAPMDSACNGLHDGPALAEIKRVSKLQGFI